MCKKSFQKVFLKMPFPKYRSSQSNFNSTSVAITNHLVPERRAQPSPPEEAELFQSPAAGDSCPGRLLARVRGRAARPPTDPSRCWGMQLGRCSWGWWEAAGSAGFGPHHCSSLVPTAGHFSCPAAGTRLQRENNKQNAESLKRSREKSDDDSTGGVTLVTFDPWSKTELLLELWTTNPRMLCCCMSMSVSQDTIKGGCYEKWSCNFILKCVISHMETAAKDLNQKTANKKVFCFCATLHNVKIITKSDISTMGPCCCYCCCQQ